MTKYIKVKDEKGSEEKYHVIKCTSNHNIFPQDLESCKNVELFIKDYSNKIIATFMVAMNGMVELLKELKEN